MTFLQASSLSISSSPSPSTTAIKRPQQHSQLPLLKIKSALYAPTSSRTPSPKLPNLKLVQDLDRGMVKGSFKTKVPFEDIFITHTTTNSGRAENLNLDKLYALLESISHRIEMHRNIGNQRQDWNTLLLTSINTITLTATTMSAIAGSIGPSSPILALKVSATLLFSAATGLLVLMNKIQPSQLVEEQRNAVRLFKQLKSRIETDIALGSVSEGVVKQVMDKLLAIDRSYPLPLLGVMIEKFPKQFEPAKWWPSSSSKKGYKTSEGSVGKKEAINGWSEKLEEDMREVVEVIKEKDAEDYMRLGTKALGLSKILAISGPLFTGLAAVGSLCVGQGQWAGVLAAVAGSLASVVNTVEHGGQVGMLLEMYRNSAGFFKLVEENVGSLLEEAELGKRENGEIFEMKVALSLGRSLSELRDLVAKSKSSCRDEFASKLF